jgi:hypothetical protein
MSKHKKQEIFQNKWTRGYHVSKCMGKVKN